MATRNPKATVGSKAAAKKSSTRMKPVRVKAAVALNAPRPVKLLSGGNPQIPKGYGDASVQAYIDAMPGWKRDIGRRLDALITRTVPNVRKAVKWNSPLYGSVGGRDGESDEEADGDHWFLSFHCFAKYIKLAFFRGTSLRPPPPVESKVEGTRYFHIHEDDVPDEFQLASWLKQASRLPGVKM